ncbi:transposase [Brucella gallinifaecis]|uniref:transposase n=1 Tax=Brucella gallinifaecis TaxID=215590 RepID=UPI00387E36DE
MGSTLQDWSNLAPTRYFYIARLAGKSVATVKVAGRSSAQTLSWRVRNRNPSETRPKWSALGFELTGGEASSSKQFDSLIETGPQVMHCAIIADKGYYSDIDREITRKAAAIPVIPYSSNRRNIPKHFTVALYQGRARIEQMTGKLKRFKRSHCVTRKQQETSD